FAALQHGPPGQARWRRRCGLPRARKDAALSKKSPKKLTAERYVARFNAEKALLARHYCTIFKFWRTCPLQRCGKARICSGDQNACLKRNAKDVPRKIQWQA